MAFYGIRFDFRNPAFAGTTMTQRYRAGIDMVEWADEKGFVVAILSEHHGSDDGYLPSALTMAAAMASRTENIRIRVAAVVPSFYDPVRLAEEVAVVDTIAGGRLDLVLTNGYVAGEFDMFGVPLSERAKRTTEAVEVLRAAWTGTPFEYRGRTLTVTPTPQQQPMRLTLGGSVPAAARRAARIGDDFMPSNAPLWEVYREELANLGKPDPGPYPGGDTSFVHVAHDTEAGFAAIAAYAMHESNAYGRWMAEAGLAGQGGGYTPFEDVEELRASGQYRVLTPKEVLAELAAKGPFAFLLLHPLMGGIPPELGWECLRLVESEVLPHAS
jgi:alkanesulfonate monooxygenase SsuD/methylene tetrahydromethanopterin reductase-like flavin-dependent oxidoreductase (luciferase family)